MLVTKRNFPFFLDWVLKQDILGFDTETYSLHWWDSPHIPVKPGVFSMQFANEDTAYYLDFHHSPDKCDAIEREILRTQVFSKPGILWFIHNAKFDMHQVANYGIEFAGRVHCTYAIQRVVNNIETRFGFSLDALCQKYFGEAKIDVKSILKKEGHFTKVKKFGSNDKYEELLHFDRLPLPLLVEYGERDTRLCFKLGIWQLEQIGTQDKEFFANVPGAPACRLSDVYLNEVELTKTFFKMERRGIKIDLEYTNRAYFHEVQAYTSIEKELNQTLDAVRNSQVGFWESIPVDKKTKVRAFNWDSGAHLKRLFEALNIPYDFTEKGTASFDKEALEKSSAPIAKLILRYRYHSKRAHTYFENFIWLADRSGFLHADVQQGGTETGRISYWDPNLQNLPKRSDRDELEYPVRRCFIPRSPDYILVSNDADQMEYRMMMDYAKERELIAQVIGGLDVHTATQQVMNAPDRDFAKTLNFMLLYGGGFAKLAHALKISLEEAKKKKYEYFAKLPGVRRFIEAVKSAAGGRGYIFTWLGRVLQYDGQTNFKAPNGLIQGGCADVIKVALNRVSAYLQPSKSALLVQVHDELLMEFHRSELDLIPRTAKLMEEAYPHKLLPLTAGTAWSDKSWKDLQDGLPSA